MGAYNVVVIAGRCDTCGSQVEKRIQFKYGDTWQHEYRVGDKLKWGGNDIGSPGISLAVADGVEEACRQCGVETDADYYVFIDDNTITRVERATGEHDFVAKQQPYIVLRR